MPSIPASEILSDAAGSDDCLSITIPRGLARYAAEAIAALLPRVVGDDADLARHELIRLALLAECENGGMTTVPVPIGTIISSIAASGLGGDGYLLMDGTSFPQGDYPYLASAMPAAWKDDTAGTFTLPDMTGLIMIGSEAGAALDVQAAGPVENRHIEQVLAPVLARESATAQTSNASRAVMYTRATTGNGTAFTMAVGEADPDPITDILPTITVHYWIKAVIS